MYYKIFLENIIAFLFTKILLINYESFDICIVSDLVLFEVMLEQIISNALKYCSIDERSGVLTLSAENSDEFVLIIQDKCIGIAESDLPKIFDKGFYCINGKTSEKATWLGLYVAKKSTQINCNINILSQLNVGTTVKITMPKKQYEQLLQTLAPVLNKKFNFINQNLGAPLANVWVCLLLLSFFRKCKTNNASSSRRRLC